jgi:predicted TIM-barrel fold metal-dependent hydrolase
VIVDFHVHRPSTRGMWGLAEYAPEDYLALMDAMGVDASVILPLDGLVHDARSGNDEVAEWCAAAPERLLPFCTVAPREHGAADELRRCVEALGMRGLKLHPWLQGFHPLEPFMEPVCREAARLGVPILIHDGTPPYSTPLQIARLAARHPDVRFVLGHGGLYDLWPEAIAAVRRHPNVYACMTSLHPLAMRALVHDLPPERLLFGTDAGLAASGAHGYALERWEELRELGLDPEVERQIVQGTPAALLERRPQ